MPDPSPETLAFLLSRRSRPAKTLGLPVPDRAALDPILTAAARTPDHGKLEPWRFIVLERGALERLAALCGERAEALGLDADARDKAVAQFGAAHLVVAVIASPVPSEKVPEVEQTLSAGAVCLALLNAALAAGWGANWLTGKMALDRPFLTDGLGLAPHEYVAGFMHLGTERMAPPERPRPDLGTKVAWVAE
ncbi:nitroreductase family protein [Oceanomicrobium pacificus]|uniref:Putative NAD(P)H nitroreductase n=1 Tax=Oceanomicrobium pacificus TaxID=2692916 RepID=A0A6B0TYV3_9RHOB|nr:nitroreductase family protein [Oceanomicrobium pacificus]MXU64081.1 nitroreductase [Oceanomicrobium pacificus]